MKTITFYNILKATRVHRTLTGLGTLMIPIAFANKVNLNVVFLCLSLIILYAAVGVQNAKKDNDYELPGYVNLVVYGLVITAFLFSLKHIIIFSTTLTILVLGLIYNFISRYVLLLDVTVVTATHHSLPMLATSLLLNLNMKLIIILCTYIYFVYWLFIHIKNLKDKEDDKNRGYKTIATEFKNGRKITLILFEISFLLMVAGYFLFKFNPIYLISLLILFFMKQSIKRNILKNNEEKALDYLRFVSVVFVYSIVLQKITELNVLLFCSIPLFVNFALLAKDKLSIYLTSKKPAMDIYSNTKGGKYKIL